jgi:hypothetical protein
MPEEERIETVRCVGLRIGRLDNGRRGGGSSHRYSRFLREGCRVERLEMLVR